MARAADPPAQLLDAAPQIQDPARFHQALPAELAR
jgi:hypothetical protein